MSEARRDDIEKKLPPLYDERIEAGWYEKKTPATETWRYGLLSHAIMYTKNTYI